MKMKQVNKKHIVLLALLALSTTIASNAQSIKAASEQQKRQQQYERELRDNEIKEAARVQRAQLNLNDLLQLLQSKDLDFVDRYLSAKGWKLTSTNVNETNDDNNDNEDLSDHKVVSWAFDKNSYNNLAKGWFSFHIYPTYDNAISYSIANETLLDKLKTELINNGYKRIYPTDAIERGLESVYRNSLYEVNFKKLIKKQYEDGADISYNFFIYNYKQIEERKAEAERIARETAEKEEKYQNTVQQAEAAYYQKQYSVAKKLYNQALSIKPENEEMLSDIIADINVNILCEEAEQLFSAKQYDKAKEKYANALTIKPNNKTDFINKKIKEIINFQQFLKERKFTIYDYKMLEEGDYNAKDNYIEDELKKYLLTNATTLPKITISLVYNIDTLGVVNSNFTSSIQNKNLNILLDKFKKNIKLKPCFLNGYSANAKAEFYYTIEYNHAIVTVNKNVENLSSSNKDFKSYRSIITNELNSAPYGKYAFDMNKTIINGQQYDNNKLIKIKDTGGPSNALLSLIVPGLGDHNVTYGKTSGLSTALWTYSIIGAGVGFKFYSNSEYAKYHSATEQTAIDDHYQKANYSNQAFYGCMITGGLIWIYDVLWVWNKGAENSKKIKAYKQSHIGLYYEPNLNATGLSYVINF